jgi:hypothetical protein
MVPWAMSTPMTSRIAPAISAEPGTSPSSAHEAAIATTGARSTHGTTCPLGEELAAVEVADPVPSREILALHRASMSDSPAIAALLAALVRHGGGPGPR